MLFSQGLIGLALSFQLLVFFSNDELKIDTVSVSTNIQEMGYDADMVSERLLDSLRIIILDSGGTHETVPNGLVHFSPLEELALALGLEHTIRELRILLGASNHELNLELKQVDDQLELSAVLLKMPDGPASRFVYAERSDDVDRMLLDFSKWVMRNIDPMTLMEYEYHRAKRTGDFSTVYAELEICRRFYPGTMRHLIENFEGMLFLKEDRQDGAATAVGYFRRALLLQPDFQEARLNLAVALAAADDVEAAELLLAEIAADNDSRLSRARQSYRAAALALQGYIAASREQMDRATGYFRQSLRAATDLAEVHELMVPVLRVRGLPTLALYHSRQAASLRAQLPPKLPLAFLDLTMLYRQLPLPVAQSRQEVLQAPPGRPS